MRGLRANRDPSSMPTNPSLVKVYRQRRTAARERPVFAASWEIVICGVCGENDWMTSSPRASDVIKFGSPANSLSEAEDLVSTALGGASTSVGALARAPPGLERSDGDSKG